MSGVIHDHLTVGELWVLDLLIVVASAAFGLAAALTVTREDHPARTAPLPGETAADRADSRAVISDQHSPAPRPSTLKPTVEAL